MKRACDIQCNECPFRTNSAPGYLGMYRVAEVFRSLWHGMPFFCHPKIDYRRKDWRERAMRSGRLCLGGLVAANRGHFPIPNDPEIAVARRAAEDRTDVDVMDWKRFGEHHKNQAYLDGMERDGLR